MKKIDCHGLTIHGLRKASQNTVNWDPRSGGYTEVFYDANDGDVWTVDQISLGHNSWTEYHDADVIKVCVTENHMTMQELADAIYSKVQEHEYDVKWDKWIKERAQKYKAEEDCSWDVARAWAVDDAVKMGWRP